ncbi:hypothetical protein EYF80_045860 [Liparis tanakae]|uniref:Uncharacterized protein n=1 Tax=Liparis tanakae TaxID=230148 RepID=A0A4Z2FRS9_9TELE|nr:hypothetical protein EYF80_045860 [Liparis tanakae]
METFTIHQETVWILTCSPPSSSSFACGSSVAVGVSAPAALDASLAFFSVNVVSQHSLLYSLALTPSLSSLYRMKLGL